MAKDGFSAVQVNFFPLSSGVGMKESVLNVKFPLSDITSLSVMTLSGPFHHVMTARGLEPDDSHSSITVFPADRYGCVFVILTSKGRTERKFMHKYLKIRRTMHWRSQGVERRCPGTLNTTNFV